VINPVGRAVDLDLPAGSHTFQADFTMPLTGRILGVGGHLHDYGTTLRLDEVRGEELREVLTLRAALDATGKLQGIERKLPGVSGRGIRLREGRTYRMSGHYDNPTGQQLANGAMVHLIGLFAPDRMHDWPGIDAQDPDYRRDLTFLRQAR
jgi:hypothetical protein